MSLEIMAGKSEHIYRIAPTDPTVIERRENKANARWVFYLKRDTANETKAALLSLNTSQDGLRPAKSEGRNVE